MKSPTRAPVAADDTVISQIVMEVLQQLRNQP